ncbi:MAG: lyase family protein, partial [Pseudomonadales bacterium]
AELASRALQKPVHPNDHVNMGQSSNDTIPTAIHVSATLAVENTLLPALGSLRDTIVARGAAAGDTIKTGRTHLMDAMPIRIDQEMGAWAFQIEQDIERLQGTLPRLRLLAQGGTAIGSGINCHPEFAARFCQRLSVRVNSAFQPSGNFFAALAGQETSAELSGQLQVTATTLTKIANDLRLMNSGPLAGLQEIALPALQPGSSIMPGKINPVIPEAVTMVAARVAGNQTTIALAAQSGNFQLNVMLPVIANALLESIELLANSATALADKAIKGLTINDAVLTKTLASNPILVTALNAKIGYELGAEIAKIAYAEGRSVLEVAKEKTDLDEDELQRLLDPRHLTGG